MDNRHRMADAVLWVLHCSDSTVRKGKGRFLLCRASPERRSRLDIGCEARTSKARRYSGCPKALPPGQAQRPGTLHLSAAVTQTEAVDGLQPQL
jgi:hypothetical protein